MTKIPTGVAHILAIMYVYMHIHSLHSIADSNIYVTALCISNTPRAIKLSESFYEGCILIYISPKLL